MGLSLKLRGVLFLALIPRHMFALHFTIFYWILCRTIFTHIFSALFLYFNRKRAIARHRIENWLTLRRD
jgi:hypothetical protein